MAKRVRLIDIADRLNISKVTVSKALRNQTDISLEMRELVKKTASEMGYTPNLLARSLHSSKTLTLGVVVPKIAHSFFSSVLDAVQEEARKSGYGILLAVSGENAELEGQHIERLLAMRVDGLLVSASKQAPDLEIYQRVKTMQIPLVFFDRRVESTGFSSVTVDDYKGAFLAVDHIVRNGCRKIAHIGGSNELELGRKRREGYEAALKKHEIQIHEPWIYAGGFDEQHGYSAFQKILQQDQIPEAVFAASFPVGLGIYAAISQHDPSLLDKIQLITFGTGGLNEFYTYPHLCVRQPTQEMGQKAVQLLLSEIQSEEDLPSTHDVLQTKLVMPHKNYNTFRPINELT